VLGLYKMTFKTSKVMLSAATAGATCNLSLALAGSAPAYMLHSDASGNLPVSLLTYIHHIL